MDRTRDARTRRAGCFVLLLVALAAGGCGGVDAPAPSSAPPQAQPIAVEDPAAVEIAAVSADEAWMVESRGLWHRTSAGWAGPIDAEWARSVSGIAALPEGRLAVATSLGTWIGNEDGWSRISERRALDVAVDGAGTLWITSASPDGWTAEGLRWYREADDSWETGAAPCPAGGRILAIASDGAVWTAGTQDNGATAGVARLEGDCSEVFPLGDTVTHDVSAIATDDRGGVVAAVMEPRGTSRSWPAGSIVTWDGDGWTPIRSGSDVANIAWSGLAFAPDGDVWAAIDGRLWRYGEGAWNVDRAVAPGGPISVAPDGTVWFVAEDAAGGFPFIERLLP